MIHAFEFNNFSLSVYSNIYSGRWFFVLYIYIYIYISGFQLVGFGKVEWYSNACHIAQLKVYIIDFIHWVVYIDRT